MDKKEILDTIKKLLSFSSTEQKFLEAKTTDGLILQVDGEAFEAGMILSIIVEDGTVNVAGAGEYVLEDGTKLMVDETGVISEVLAAEVEEEVVEEVMEEVEVAEIEVEEEVAVEEETNVNIEQKILTVEDKITDIIKTIDKIEAQLDISNQVFEKLQKFMSDTPADLGGISLKDGFKNVNKEKKNTIDSKLEEIRNLRKK